MTTNLTHSAGRPYLHWRCPGCKTSHVVPVDGPNAASPRWTWNQDRNRPTLEPSVLVHAHDDIDEDGDRIVTPRCHVFIRDGRIQFLGDCTHALAGQTVEIPTWPYAPVADGAR